MATTPKMASTSGEWADFGLTHVRFEVGPHGVATALLDVKDEKMNVLAAGLAEDLELVFTRVRRDPGIRALVLGSAKRTGFMAGADIKMLDKLTSVEEATRGSREAQAGMDRLEAIWRDARKPVVAAIHGPCLGGGLELALACQYRVVSDSPKTKLGLPEVKIGLLPGAGGTQRLPRLIGIANGLDHILTGKNCWPRKAVKIGLAEEAVPEAILLDVARRRAREAADAGGEHPKWADDGGGLDGDTLKNLALEENPFGRRLLFKKAKETLLAQTRGNYPAPEKALAAVQAGIEDGLQAGYAAEAKGFGELLGSREAKSLMSIFFATTELKKDSGVDDPAVKPRAVDKVGVLGGGLMGGGIAAVTAMKAGARVRINEVDDAGIGRGLSYVQRLVDKEVKRRTRTEGDAARLMHRVTGTAGYGGFADCDVVIEAVFEDLELKRRVLKDVEARTRPDCIFASNTSSLPITDIATASSHPETVIGMHYFSPVEKMPLLEIIVTDDTADWVTATCVKLGKQQGKTVIVVRDGVGFYTSRILGPYMNEAAWLLTEGVAIEQIDEAMKDWGFPVGPIVLLDEVGIDVAHKVGKIVREAFGDRVQAPDGGMDALIADGRLGRKAGKGFYLYKDGKKQGVDESVYAVLAAASPGAGGPNAARRRLPADEIQQRLSLAMINEAALCLQEGILRSPRDGDIGAIFGLGFPPHAGGPFRYLDRLGADEVVRRLERLQAKHGERFAPAQILKDHAKTGAGFHPTAPQSK